MKTRQRQMAEEKPAITDHDKVDQMTEILEQTN